MLLQNRRAEGGKREARKQRYGKPVVDFGKIFDLHNGGSFLSEFVFEIRVLAGGGRGDTGEGGGGGRKLKGEVWERGGGERKGKEES